MWQLCRYCILGVCCILCLIGQLAFADCGSSEPVKSDGVHIWGAAPTTYYSQYGYKSHAQLPAGTACVVLYAPASTEPINIYSATNRYITTLLVGGYIEFAYCPGEQELHLAMTPAKTHTVQGVNYQTVTLALTADTTQFYTIAVKDGQFELEHKNAELAQLSLVKYRKIHHTIKRFTQDVCQSVAVEPSSAVNDAPLVDSSMLDAATPADNSLAVGTSKKIYEDDLKYYKPVIAEVAAAVAPVGNSLAAGASKKIYEDDLKYHKPVIAAVAPVGSSLTVSGDKQTIECGVEPNKPVASDTLCQRAGAKRIHLVVDVGFAFNQYAQSAVTSLSQIRLTRVMNMMSSDVQLQRVDIVGFSDVLGPPGLNKVISLKRAQTIKHWLVLLGVDAKIIHIAEQGSTDYIRASCELKTEPHCYVENRRVEITFSGYM